MKKLLIVEDEKAIADGLQFNFEQEGYEVLVAVNGPSALEILEQDPAISAVILDLMLPGMSGYEICKEIRTNDTTIPVLVLSARLTSDDKAHAFDCGADQYVTKPFDLTELLSRVRQLVKSRGAVDGGLPEADTTTKMFEFDNVVVDCEGFRVDVADNTHELTAMEMQLLRYFLENQGRVLSRIQIMQDVWDQSANVSSRTIDNFVMRLRRILEPDPSNPKYISSIRGLGYRFATVANSDKTSDS